jgi:hypothetical protein
MKATFKSVLAGVLVSVIAALSLTSCYETRYVHEHNHHTRGWYDRRHVPPPAGVSFEVDVRHR